ncbi:MAG: hypothetical protein KDD58_05295 [Bdellovibrionales bacterium]|nr:hypothetical protein [Bdellovibrionales bacterium]
MDEILEEFKLESEEILDEMLTLLEEVEEDPTLNPKLEDFGQRVDRIMGSSSVLAMQNPSPLLANITIYSELCKLIGYKCSQVDGNSELSKITVAFLLDATEMLQDFIQGLGQVPEPSIKEALNEAFKSRLQMIAGKFDENLRASVSSSTLSNKTTQSQIDDLFEKLK